MYYIVAVFSVALSTSLFVCMRSAVAHTINGSTLKCNFNLFLMFPCAFKTRETDELRSQGAEKAQYTAAHLSNLLNHPFDHIAFKACNDQNSVHTVSLRGGNH